MALIVMIEGIKYMVSSVYDAQLQYLNQLVVFTLMTQTGRCRVWHQLCYCAFAFTRRGISYAHRTIRNAPHQGFSR